SPVAEHKSQALLTLTQLGDARWTGGGYAGLATEGFARNPIVYRCVRLIAESAARVPWAVTENGTRLSDQPVLSLLARPNPQMAGPEFFESAYAFLQTAGNSYLQAVVVDGEVKGLFCLRPDRMRAEPGRDGYPVAYSYTSAGKTVRFNQLAM